jgi:Histidine kinase-, DNA gyrase B-, and HSP90-like ATPase
MVMKKLSIVGASVFVNRMFEACGNYQWVREFLKNSLEANATKVEFGIEWQAVEKLGVYRRTVIDNGIGMNRDELLRFFSTLGEGAKRIGGVHDNFGVGAKIAALPWNPEGVVVISYKDGQGSMIQIEHDPEISEYRLVEFQSEDSTTYVIDPQEVDWGDDINWGAVAPDWSREDGTIVILLGSEEAPDTVLGNPKAGEKDIKGLSVYLNTRFWDLSQTEVAVVELRSERKTSWPQGASDRDDVRRPNRRQIMGTTSRTSSH